MTDTTPTPDLKALSRTGRDPAATPDQLQACAGRGEAIDRLLAKHPNASAQLLEQLSHSSDKATRAGVAANPSTTPADLVRLGQQFPKEFLSNPALDLLLLVNPTLLEDAPPRLMVQILRSDRCPPELLVWAVGRGEEEVQLAVAMHPNVPIHAIERLRHSAHVKVRQALEAIAEAGARQGNMDAEATFRKAVGERLGTLCYEDARRAWRKGYIGLAQYSCLALSTRLRLNGIRPAVAVWIAEKGIDTVELLQTLSRAPDVEVRELVAASAATPAHLLKVMVDEADAARQSDTQIGDVLSHVARNPCTPLDVLEQLVHRPSLTRAVAANPNCSSELLERLMAADAIGAKIGLAENPATVEAQSRSLMEEVAKAVDPRGGEWRYLEAIARNWHSPSWWLGTAASEGYRNLKFHIAANPRTPPEALELLAGAGPNVRLMCAMNPSPPIHVLEALAKDRYWQVRKKLAENPSLPVTLLEAMSQDPDSRVAGAAASNHKTPRALLEKLIKHPSNLVRAGALANELVPNEWLESGAKRTSAALRKAVANNPRTPAHLLAALASDGDLQVRLGVTLNPSTPIEIATPVARRLLGTGFKEMNWVSCQFDKATEEVMAACHRADVLYANLSGREFNPHICVRSRRPAAALMALSAGPILKPSELVQCTRSTDWLLRAAAARNRATPPNLLKRLGGDVHPLVAQLALSTLSTTRAPLLGPLDLDKARIVRAIGRFMSDSDGANAADPFWVQFCTPADALANALCKFSGEDMSLVRDLRAHLDLEEWIRLARSVAEHEAMRDQFGDFFSETFSELPPVVVMALDDHHEGLAGSENASAELLSLLAQTGNPEVKEQVAKNLRCPVEVLTKLGTSRSVRVRMAVAANPRSDMEVRRILARDKDPSVRASVGANSSGLAPGEHGQVSDSLAKNPSAKWLFNTDTVDKALAHLMTRGQTPPHQAQGELLDIELRDALLVLRAALQREQDGDAAERLHYDALTLEDLRRVAIATQQPEWAWVHSFRDMVYSVSWVRRLLAAVHPDASEAHRRLLTWDDDPDVAATARLALHSTQPSAAKEASERDGVL